MNAVDHVLAKVEAAESVIAAAVTLRNVELSGGLVESEKWWDALNRLRSRCDEYMGLGGRF